MSVLDSSWSREPRTYLKRSGGLRWSKMDVWLSTWTQSSVGFRGATRWDEVRTFASRGNGIVARGRRGVRVVLAVWLIIVVVVVGGCPVLDNFERGARCQSGGRFVKSKMLCAAVGIVWKLFVPTSGYTVHSMQTVKGVTRQISMFINLTAVSLDDDNPPKSCSRSAGIASAGAARRRQSPHGAFITT